MKLKVVTFLIDFWGWYLWRRSLHVSDARPLPGKHPRGRGATGQPGHDRPCGEHQEGQGLHLARHPGLCRALL